jgi:hypothetical protein
MPTGPDATLAETKEVLSEVQGLLTELKEEIANPPSPRATVGAASRREYGVARCGDPRRGRDLHSTAATLSACAPAIRLGERARRSHLLRAAPWAPRQYTPRKRSASSAFSRGPRNCVAERSTCAQHAFAPAPCEASHECDDER